jgi:hypothetical protein
MTHDSSPRPSGSEPPPAPQWRSMPETPCHRCGADLYGVATMPHPTMPGHRTLPLCPRCDAADPAAHGLLAFFAVHGEVTADTAGEFNRLAAGWLEAVLARPTGISGEQVEREAGAWRRGDFDE